jgi:hypothetical protein
MKINSVKRFILEDFNSEVRPWLGKLLQPLNTFMEQTLSALSNGLTITSNFKAKKYEVTVAAAQSYPMKLAYNLNERPTEVRIAYLVEDSGSPSTPTNPYSVYWQYTDGGLQVTFIGLDPAKRYKIILVAQV